MSNKPLAEMDIVEREMAILYIQDHSGSAFLMPLVHYIRHLQNIEQFHLRTLRRLALNIADSNDCPRCPSLDKCLAGNESLNCEDEIMKAWSRQTAKEIADNLAALEAETK